MGNPASVIFSSQRSGLGAGLLLGMFFGLHAPGPVYAVDAAGVQVETLVRSGASWDGQTLPAYPEDRPEITILRIRIPPGTQLPLHKHPVINAGVLLGGTLTVVAKNGQTLRLNAGDALVELVDSWHYGRNDGDVPAEIVVFYAGVKNAPITLPHPAD
jgi:quercetin dioxygenase-like cupin family protein